METSLRKDVTTQGSPDLLSQVIWFGVHTLIALTAWCVLMIAGYFITPGSPAQSIILLVSFLFPLLVGFLINKFRQDDMATLVWLMGMILMLLISLYVLDLPTGPNECFHCEAGEKLARTFFSVPSPSGLMDDDGPFLATWPAAALLGYSIGARLAFKPRKIEDED